MSHTEKTPPRNWPWIVAVIVGVAVIVVGASVVSSMISNGNAAAPAVSETPAPPSTDEPTDAPTNTETVGETAVPDDDDGTIDEDDITAIEDAIESSTPQDLYDLLANPVHLRFAASDFDADRTPNLAVTDLDYIEGSSGWNWDLGDDMLATFQAGKYADEFPDGAIVGESAEGYVISITIDATDVTSIFISKSESLVTEPAATP
jgi:hypothetical protein